MSFVTNPFMYVDMTSTAQQLSGLFNLDAGQVEIEILILQNDLHLKAHQCATNFWCPVDKEKYSYVCTAAMKIACFLVQPISVNQPFSPHRLYQEQTQNLPYRCRRLTENCSVKL